MLALALLAGCSSLPHIVPDMARAAPAVRARGRARAAVGGAQSKAVLDGLRARGGRSTDVLERHLALEEAIAGSPLLTGNKVSCCRTGRPPTQAMFAAIAAARDHINMETYILEDDEVGQALRRRADRQAARRACRST